MIEPTVGRVVWYWPHGSSHSQPYAATIAFVQTNRVINIGYLTHEGVPDSARNVRLLQDDDADDGHAPFCTWMPYQIGQAKAHAQSA